MPPPSPILEPQIPTGSKSPLRNIFKAGTFSQKNPRTDDRPPRPPGFKPRPLHEFEIRELYPNDDPVGDAAPLSHGGTGPTPTPDHPSQGDPPPFSLAGDPLIISALDHEFFEEYSRFLNSLPDGPSSAFLSDPDLLAPSSLSSSYHPLPIPAALNQQHLLPDRPLLPLYNPSTSSLTPSETLLLKPQGFFSFLWEYTTSFVSYVLDVNVSSKGKYGLGRTRARRDTAFYGERDERGLVDGRVDGVLKDRDRDRGERA